MLSYIIRRTAYSMLIIIGVMIVTFLLFRVAAGDPAAAVLGKNPSPEALEKLRGELGVDKPLFWGRWRKTEVYTSMDFNEARNLPGVIIPDDAIYENDGITLDSKPLVFKRNFNPESGSHMMRIVFKGVIKGDYEYFSAPDWTTRQFISESPAPEIEIVPPAGKKLHIRRIEFFKASKHFWDTQLLDSFREMVSFSTQFPYVSFLNFGRTLTTREPVKDIIIRGIPPSLMIMLPIFFGELILGIVLALFATAFKDSWVDRLIVLFAVTGMSVSYLVFIIFGQWYLGYYYNFFPVWGYGTMQHLLLPIIIGIASGLGGGVRFYRTVFVNELNHEYLRTARAKGCGEFSVYGRHLLRNASIPIITRASTVLPFLFTGSLLLETFFGIPGLGYAGVNALNNSDLQMIKALVVIGAMMFVAVNLITDIIYAWVDPRIRLK